MGQTQPDSDTKNQNDFFNWIIRPSLLLSSIIETLKKEIKLRNFELNRHKTSKKSSFQRTQLVLLGKIN